MSLLPTHCPHAAAPAVIAQLIERVYSEPCRPPTGGRDVNAD